MKVKMGFDDHRVKEEVTLSLFSQSLASNLLKNGIEKANSVAEIFTVFGKSVEDATEDLGIEFGEDEDDDSCSET